jgi:SSS family solute:Na+ symporter
MHHLDEWGLGGRSFGAWVTWFLIGGDLYTAYTFVAVPALLYSAGSADFVRARFGSPTLALLVALTGIIATMPYIALQLVGIEAVLIAFVKDTLIYIVIAVAVLYIPYKLGGWGAVFDAADRKFTAAGKGSLLLSSSMQLPDTTLAFGSALALFLYPHSATGVLACKSRDTVRRNPAALPAYTVLLGLIALLGYMAIAAVGIGALVPAAIMSIAAANLFTRNIYKEYLAPRATPAEEARVSKLASLVVKFGAPLFIVAINPQLSIDLQLIGGVIILQTLPAVALGVFTHWLHRGGLIAGWLAGMSAGLWMLYVTPNPAIHRAHFGSPAFALDKLGLPWHVAVYAGFLAVLINLLVAALGTAIARSAGWADGRDAIQPYDYVADAGDPRVAPIPGRSAIS